MEVKREVSGGKVKYVLENYDDLVLLTTLLSHGTICFREDSNDYMFKITELRGEIILEGKLEPVNERRWSKCIMR